MAEQKSSSYSLKYIAESLGANVQGDEGALVSGLASLDNATNDDISFLSSEKYIDGLKTTAAGAVVIKHGVADDFSGNAILADDPYLAFAKLSALFDPRPERATGIHPSAVVEDSATVDPTASVGANCYIGENVTIGAGCEIYPNVTISENSVVGDNALIYSNVSIYSQVRIGSNVIIHSGTVIGSDGFGFAPTREGWVKIHQLGGVVIGDDVEIGASTAIDRGALEDTIIESGVIIDNQVHIAHNVKIGEGSAIAGCVGIAGSTTLGKKCVVAGAVAINGHIEIADGTQFHGGTIVTKGVKEPGVYASAPPMQDVRKWRKSAVRYAQLDEFASKLKKIEKEVFKD